MEGSGWTSMSDSKTRARPSMEEPSKPRPFFEGALHLGRGQRHRLQRTDDVGEPQPDKPHVALFDGSEDEFLLAVHGLPFTPVRNGL